MVHTLGSSAGLVAGALMGSGRDGAMVDQLLLPEHGWVPDVSPWWWWWCCCRSIVLLLPIDQQQVVADRLYRTGVDGYCVMVDQSIGCCCCRSIGCAVESVLGSTALSSEGESTKL